ncbi:MAG: hypothetical protein LDL31_07430 [Prosthecobacter sp.]|nr:hypothetical protein [Prosthecobacter sp.]
MSRLLLLLILYATLAYAWHRRLHPVAAAPEMTAQVREERLERLTHYLTKAPPETVRPILLSIALLTDEQLEKTDAWLARPTLEQLRELTVQNSPMLENSGTLRDALLLGWLGQENVTALQEAHLMICAAGDRLDDTMRLHALNSLAERARKAGDTRTALSILERAVAFPGAPWSIVQSFAETAQESTRSAAVLTIVDTWLRRHPGADATDLEAAKNKRNALMIRCGRAAEALLDEIEQLKALPADAPLPEACLQRALAAARACSDRTTLMPWLERHLTRFPEHSQDAVSLLKQPSTISTAYRHWLHEVASAADLELPVAQAYTLCRQLAATGEAGALLRLCQLASAAKMEQDAENFLGLALADAVLRPAILALACKNALARRAVQTALQAAPADRDLHYAATLAECAANPTAAAATWQAYLRRFPQDHAARRRLVQAHLSLQQPGLALRVLEGFAESAMTEEDRHQRGLLRQL